MPETDRPLTPVTQQEIEQLCERVTQWLTTRYKHIKEDRNRAIPIFVDVKSLLPRALATITALERNLADETQARLTEVEHWVERYRLNDEWRQQTSQLLAKETQKRATAYAEGQRDAIQAFAASVEAEVENDASSTQSLANLLGHVRDLRDAPAPRPAPAPTGEEPAR